MDTEKELKTKEYNEIQFLVRSNHLSEASQKLKKIKRSELTFKMYLLWAEIYSSISLKYEQKILQKALKFNQEMMWVNCLLLQNFDKQKNLFEKKKYYDFLDKSEPKTSLDFCAKGFLALYKNEETKIVKKFFKKASKLDENNLYASFHLFKIYQKKGEIKKCKRILKSILNLEPNNFKALKLDLELMKHSPEKALKRIADIKQVCRIDWEITKAEADCYKNLENYQEAIKLYYSLLYCKDLKPQILFWVGQVLVKMGHYKKVKLKNLITTRRSKLFLIVTTKTRTMGRLPWN
jgi:tetratricopeptide (TPR) repeat protein